MNLSKTQHEFHFKTIKGRILAFFLLCSFIPFLILAGASWYHYQKTIKENALSYTQEVMALTSTKLENLFNQLDQYYFAVYSKKLPRLLAAMETPSVEQVKSELMLQETIIQLQGFYGLTHTIPYLTIVSDEGKILYQNDRASISSYAFSKAPWFCKFIESDAQTALSPAQSLPYQYSRFAKTDTRYFSYAWKISDYQATKHRYIFIMDIPSASIHALLSSLVMGDTGSLFLLNETDLIDSINPVGLTSSEITALMKDSQIQSTPYMEHKGRTSYLISSYSIPSTSLTILCRNAASEITNHLPSLIPFTLFLLAASMLLTLLLSSYFSSRLVKPIRNLKQITYEVMQGNLNVTVPPLTHDEIGDLGNCIDQMLGHIRQLINEKYAYTIREKELQIHTLQSQINPHFLYNTLETISSIAENEGIDEISTIAVSMADLYRYSISSSDHLVPIRDEIAYIRNYLDIMRIRFGDRIHIRFQLDPDAMDDPIMKLTLQPLIENAIYHGLEDKRTGGCLTIAINVIENFDEILIKDNGIGMSSTQLFALQAEMSDQLQDNESTTGHIGVNNVYKRLKLRFGKDCEMQISSESGVGTTILLRLPRIPSVPL